MQRVITFVLAGLFVFSLAIAEEHEKEVVESQVPKAVLSAFTSSYPGAAVKEYAEESEDGITFYEISCEFENRLIDILYNPNGSVAEVEEKISPERLPGPVKTSITKDFKKASIELAEQKLADGQVFYEVIVVVKDEKYEALYTESGKLIEKKELDEEEGEDND
jgi:hypothetical protein